MGQKGFKHTNPDVTLEMIDRVRNLPSLAIGFPASKAGGLKYPDGTDVIDVAVWNNYGTDKIPERPFMDVGGRNAVRQTQDLRKKLIGKILTEETTPEDALDLVGAKAAAIVKKTIQSWAEPPNSPETIARKKSDHPLVDTGLMTQSITWEQRKREAKAK